MKKSQVEKIESFIKFLNTKHEITPFEYEINEYFEGDYKLILRVVNTAYLNEANALAMVIDGCTYLNTRLKYDSEKGVIWEIK